MGVETQIEEGQRTYLRIWKDITFQVAQHKSRAWDASKDTGLPSTPFPCGMDRAPTALEEDPIGS